MLVCAQSPSIPFSALSPYNCYYCSVAKLCLILCDPMYCSMPGFPVLHYLPEFVQIHVHWASDAIQPSHPLSSPTLALSLSQHQGLFQGVPLLIRWWKYWSFSFSVSASNECSELISFKIDWFDLHAVQGTLESLQHHSSKASILWRSAFFMVQLSHLYMITRKTIALTIWTFVRKWCLCFLICCLGLSQLSFQGASIF